LSDTVARTLHVALHQSVTRRNMECSTEMSRGILFNLCDISSSYDTRPDVSQLT